ncbi:unnamed protein product, partial [Staurois parvus]
IPRRHPAISENYQRGRDLCINNIDLSPVSFCTLLCMALYSRAIQNSVLTLKHSRLSKTHSRQLKL